MLIGNDRTLTYQNVLSARSQGIEGSLGWTSPQRTFALDGNATYQSLRNTSDEGTFAPYEGDRLPNRPYFFVNGSATLFGAHGVHDVRPAAFEHLADMERYALAIGHAQHEEGLARKI